MLFSVLISLALADGDLSTPPVVGGHEVEAGMWEDTAAIYFGNEVGCTGVLIAPDVVITAGHCNEGIDRVKLGTNDYNNGGEIIRVAEIHEYPNSLSTYDLAILILEKSSDIEPRVIAQDCILDDHLYDGADVTIVGYGAIDPQGYQYVSTLMEGTTVIDDADCTELSTGCNASVSPEGELGAGARDNVDSCYGDSGGPLYLNTDEGDFLVGITSRGYNSSSWDCGHGGIYVRPDAVIDWIEEVIGQPLATPECGGSEDDQDGSPNLGGGGGDGGFDDGQIVGGCACSAGPDMPLSISLTGMFLTGLMIWRRRE